MSIDTVDDYCKALKSEIHLTNVSVTALSTRAKDMWKSPRGTMIRIEILVTLTAILFFVLATFGRKRRRSRKWYIQKGVFGAFILSSSLATYTLGSMQSSSLKSVMYPVWAISLFLLHGCTDTITAHSLSDNTQITKLLYQAGLYYSYGIFLVFSDPNMTTYASWESRLIYSLYVLSIIKFSHRLATSRLATQSWNLNKMVADYMREEHKMGGEIDPVTVEGCCYLVDWPLEKPKLNNETNATEITAQNEVIDMKKIWLCRSLDMELKYECLSFSLFHLLRSRVFGFAFGESKIKAHDFVFKGILSHPENDYSRVFKVIEAELAFMYDFYFTKYAAIYYASRTATAWYLVSAACICLTAYYGVHTRVWRFSCAGTEDLSFIFNTTADGIITLVILASAALIELVQMLFFWTSVWGRVSFACQHVREEATENRSSRGRVSCCCMMIMMTLKRLLANIGMRCDSKKHYWQHELGQYSLIDAVSKRIERCNPWTANQKDPHLPNLFIMYLRPLMTALCLSEPAAFSARSVRASKIRGEQLNTIKLDEQVKKALVLSLVSTEGELTNGKKSLRVNEAGSLSWACEWNVHPETSCIVLTWHIATCYCEMIPSSGAGIKQPEFGIATTLSRYCAYLVVSEPKLLPGHHYDTARVFDAAAEEAIHELLKSGATNTYEAMKNLAVPQVPPAQLPPATVFGRGVALGKELEGMPESRRWKVMADFWAEMLLYAAPSDNVNTVNEHIEKLAYGGEFITHLWALLSHAGILAREAKPQPGYP